MSLSYLAQINAELADLRDSNFDQADSYITFLLNSKRKYNETVNTILDTDTLVEAGKYFQCDLGVFEVRQLQNAIISSDINVQIPVQIEENGQTVTNYYDYSEIIESMGASMCAADMYITALESIKENEDNLSDSLDAFVAKMNTVSSVMLNKASSTYNFLASTLSNSYTNMASMMQSIVTKACLTTDNVVSWLNEDATSLTGVSLTSVFNQTFWPSVGSALAGMGSIIATCISGVFGIAVAILNGVWTAVKTIVSSSQTEVAIIGKADKGNYPGLYCYDRDIFELNSNEFNNDNSRALIQLSYALESILNSSSYKPGIWVCLPIGCMNVNMLIKSYTSRYVWDILLCFKDVLPIGLNNECWNTDLSNSGLAWTNPIEFIKSLKKKGYDGNGSDEVIGEGLQYPTTAVASSLMMSRIISCWYACMCANDFYVNQGSYIEAYHQWANSPTDPDNAGYGLPTNLSSGWMGTNSIYFNVSGTPQGEFVRLTNGELFNSISGQSFKQAILANDNGSQWYTRFVKCIITALPNYTQNMETYSDEPWNRWWRTSLPTPRYYIKSDLALRATYSAIATAAVSAVVLSTVTIAACAATAALKRIAYNSRRKADIMAFDKNVSSKQSYKANKTASIFESLYLSSSKTLNYGATTAIEIGEKATETMTGIMGNKSKNITNIFDEIGTSEKSIKNSIPDYSSDFTSISGDIGHVQSSIDNIIIPDYSQDLAGISGDIGRVQSSVDNIIIPDYSQDLADIANDVIGVKNLIK